ncbi:MAG: methyltransferase domain-containing protein [Candidatus Natronoplasma sp.]
MNEEVERWEKEKGIEFLKQLGLKEGDDILDFGAGYGHYTVPAAEVVDDRGTVHALDKKEEPLYSIEKKASEHDLGNIKPIKNTGGVDLKLRSGSVDAVFLFDVLHYFKRNKRKKLYSEVFRVLRPKKRLYVYPKHTKKNRPSGEFEDMEVEDVIEEISGEGFDLKEKFCGTIMHDQELTEDCVLIFIRGG